MKAAITTCKLLFLTLALTGQNTVFQNLYLLNPLVINPANAGSQKTGEAQVMYKKFLSGIDNAPTSQLFSINTPIPKKRIGVGLNLYNDLNGGTSFKGIEGIFAYHINYDTMPLNESKFHLSFGISTTLDQYSIDKFKLLSVESNDPIITNRKLASFYNNANVGLLLFNRGFSFGLSMYNIIPIPNKIYPSSLEPNVTPVIYIQSSYLIPLNNQFSIIPGIMFNTQKNANYHVDTNIGLSYKINQTDYVQLISTYKSFSENLSKGSQAVAFNFLINFSSFFVGFHFEIPTSIVSNYSSGGHAFHFGYKFKSAKPKLLQSQLEEF